MGYTVNMPGGTKNGEFEAYARLLRQQGKDLGKLPRVPEINTGAKRSWLYVWNTRDDAQAFAKELRKRTGQKDWEVIEIDAPPSEAPFGPLLIQLGRRADGIYFALHALSRALMRSAFPRAMTAGNVFIDRRTVDEFRERQGRLGALVRQVAPALTGLTAEELENLGYAVIDDESEETLLFEPPAELARIPV